MEICFLCSSISSKSLKDSCLPPICIIKQLYIIKTEEAKEQNICLAAKNILPYIPSLCSSEFLPDTNLTFILRLSHNENLCVPIRYPDCSSSDVQLDIRCNKSRYIRSSPLSNFF